jgi:hypothetical protein
MEKKGEKKKKRKEKEKKKKRKRIVPSRRFMVTVYGDNGEMEKRGDNKPAATDDL